MHWKTEKWSSWLCCTENLSFCSVFATLQRKYHFCTPRKETARPQFQFPHSCILAPFIYSQDRSTYFPAAIAHRNINVGIWMRPHSFISGNICFEFSVFCLCNVQCVKFSCTDRSANHSSHIHPRCWGFYFVKNCHNLFPDNIWPTVISLTLVNCGFLNCWLCSETYQVFRDYSCAFPLHLSDRPSLNIRPRDVWSH